MPRTARAAQAGFCYHALNRGNGRREVFHDDADYRAFVQAMADATLTVRMRLVAYCLMPNHFHMVVWPQGDGDLGRWMHRLMNAHVRRYRRRYRGSGHVWQGRFKAFPIQEDDHLLTVLRYVERNPVRAGLADRAQDWPWSSAGWVGGVVLHPGPTARPADWLDWVNRPITQGEAKKRCHEPSTVSGGGLGRFPITFPTAL
jgi:putative transposase